MRPKVAVFPLRFKKKNTMNLTTYFTLLLHFLFLSVSHPSLTGSKLSRCHTEAE